MVARGEIWWYEAPERKRRPVLIITRNSAIPVLVDVVGVPATGNVRNIPSELALGMADGMPADGVLAFDNLGLYTKVYFTRRITSLPQHRWREVCDALLFTVAC